MNSISRILYLNPRDHFARGLQQTVCGKQGHDQDRHAKRGNPTHTSSHAKSNSASTHLNAGEFSASTNEMHNEYLRRMRTQMKMTLCTITGLIENNEGE